MFDTSENSGNINLILALGVFRTKQEKTKGKSRKKKGKVMKVMQVVQVVQVFSI